MQGHYSIQLLQKMSLHLPFERIKRIDVKFKHIISGYIRNMNASEIPESILAVILLFYYNTIESSILTHDECDKLLSLFEEANVFKKLRLYSYKLLYKGTRDGFTSNIFYEKCNKKENTLCIIHTPQNNVFGGYTSIPWNREESGYYRSDSSAFIYAIRWSNGSNPKVFPVKNDGRKAITQADNSFLKFGPDGHGFYFYQSGNDSIQGYASWDICEEYGLDYQELNGVNHTFEPTEIEVFQLK